MKKILGTLAVVLITAAWIFLVTSRFSGLNSILNLADYRTGLLSLRPPPAQKINTIHTSACRSGIYVDSLGIPHIFGDDNNSLAYSLGYMHARDRYFQMELLTHIVTGRLSEIIGEAGIRSDRMWRPFRTEETVLRVMDSLSRTEPELVSYLNAYAQGVNDYIGNENKAHRDPLYLAWNYNPQPWKPYYSFFIQWYMSFDLSFSNDFLNKQELLDKLPVDIRKALYPAYPDHEPFIIPGSEEKAPNPPDSRLGIHTFTADQVNNYPYREQNSSLGSNNWVVGPARTKSGSLFLCNDLHLFLSSPNIFYEAQLYSPGMHVYGYTIPGVPLVVTGHNEKIAWGITNGGWDVSEQYLIKLKPGDDHQYWLDGKWLPLENRHFTLLVKDGRPVNMEVPYTVFGPMQKRDSLAIASRWHPAIWNAAIRSFWKLARAADWDSFKEALRYYDYPSQNFAYADVKGNIGMICAGKMPLKPDGYAGGVLDGTLSPELRYIPFDSLPLSFNPARGYLFSANQEPERNKYYYSSRWFEDLYRPARINELLAAGDTPITARYVQEMQSDVMDLSVKDWQKLIAKYTQTGDLSSNWRSIAGWDGRLVPGKQQAFFYKAMRQAVNLNSRGIASALGVRITPVYDQFMHFLLKGDTLSFKGKEFSSRECFKEILRQTDSIYKADSTQANVSGRRPGENDYSFSIPQMTFLPGFDLWVKDIGGSENTINVNYRRAHPVIRTLIEIRDNAIQSRMVNATGQTGRLNSPGYMQQFQSWMHNELHPTQFVKSPQQVQAVTQEIHFTK